MAKPNSRYAVTVVGHVIKATFTDAAKSVVAVDTSKLPAGTIDRGLKYGIRQRLQDVTAGKELAESLDAMRRAAKAMMDGTWEISSVNTEDLIKAIVKQLGKPEADVRKIVEAANLEKVKSWLAVPAIASHIADIEAARAREFAKANSGTDALKDFA